MTLSQQQISETLTIMLFFPAQTTAVSVEIIFFCRLYCFVAIAIFFSNCNQIHFVV